jgi:6-phosphogluconolactonase
MDPASGRLELAAAANAGPNPSWLAFHPNHRFLYAANERGEGQISALAIDPASGAPRLLNSQPIPGAVPCYASLDPSGRWLMAANYGSGSLVVLAVGEDGRVGPISDHVQHLGSGPNPKRQEGPHAHSILFDPAGRFVVSADLGLDQVLIYKLDAQNGRLIPNNPPYGSTPPGSGPRHLAFHPNGKFLFVSNEVDSTITSMAWDAEKGALQPVHTLSTLPEGWNGENSVADIHVAPSGRYVYVSNRGHHSLAIFSTNEWTGTLFPNGHVSTGGAWPRNFAIDPDGAFLLAANQNSGTIVSFRLEPGSGQLIPTRQVTPVPSPVCIKMADL